MAGLPPSLRALAAAGGAAPVVSGPRWEARRYRLQRLLEQGASVDEAAMAERLTPRQVRVMLAGMSPDNREATDADIAEGISHSPTPYVK